MNTLEIRSLYPFAEAILWQGQTAAQVRDRLYPGVQLVQRSVLQRSTNPQVTFCTVYTLDNLTEQLIEQP
jgi:hypothetical protein